MSSGSFAKEELVEDFLSALLTEETVDDNVQRDSVAKLLESAQPQTLKSEKVQSLSSEQKTPIDAKVIHQEVEKEEQAEVVQQADTYAELHEHAFQALFFEVSGLKLAVPLTELGGIHKLDKIGPLFGKPDWFKGVMLHRDEKLSVVDTAKWVMPEKYDEKLAESLNYQYLIMLDESGWGLACESLVNTETLQPEDVNWREAHGKRPWLAGMVKQKMCALINVNEMVSMLEQGLGSNDQ